VGTAPYATVTLLFTAGDGSTTAGPVSVVDGVDTQVAHHRPGLCRWSLLRVGGDPDDGDPDGGDHGPPATPLRVASVASEQQLVWDTLTDSAGFVELGDYPCRG
jgi:hypothetical protein